MSLKKGNLTAIRCLALGQVPEQADILKGLKENQFRPFEDGLEEERNGFCDWTNLKMTVAEERTTFIGDGLAVFGLRIDKRKVPSELLRAEVDMRIKALTTEKDLAFIGKEARISIEDDVKVELLKKVLPSPKLVEVIWHLKSGLVWCLGGSSVQGLLAGLFIKAWGIELKPMGVADWAAKVAPEIHTDALLALDSMSVTDDGGGTADHMNLGFLGEEYLIWLWMRGLTEGGKGHEEDDSSLFLDDTLVMSGELRDAKEMTLKRGNPSESEDAFRGLLKGMRLSKAKIRILNGDLQWGGTLTSALALSGLKLPPSSPKDLFGLASDRIFLLEECYNHLESRFKAFLTARVNDPEAMRETLVAWAHQGMDGAEDFVEEAPWKEA